MDNTTLVAIIVAIVVVALGIAAFAYLRQRRTGELRSRFGSEYDRQLQESGNRERAEAALLQRQQRVQRLRLRPLTPEDSRRFTDAWNGVQTRFVDDPKGAVTQADQLLVEVMSTRGYPVGEFEQQAADISVNHPSVVENYRAAHNIALRHARGEASTEDLRQAMIHYRTLFGDLLGERVMTKSRGPEAYEEEKERKRMV